MKKTVVFLISVLLLLAVVGTASTTFAADLSDNIVLQLTGTHTDDQIVINANLVTNTGISAMTLELVYDNSVFEFVGYEKGQALERLDLMSTNLSQDPTLPVKFNWFNQDSGFDNDFSTGNLLRLYFNLKPDSRGGETEIGFKYDPQSDVVYLSGNHPQTKYAAVGKAVVNVEQNRITEIEIKDAIEKSVNLPLIIGIAVSATVLLGGAAALLIIKIRKERRKKKNWLKL